MVPRVENLLSSLKEITTLYWLLLHFPRFRRLLLLCNFFEVNLKKKRQNSHSKKIFSSNFHQSTETASLLMRNRSRIGSYYVSSAVSNNNKSSGFESNKTEEKRENKEDDDQVFIDDDERWSSVVISSIRIVICFVTMMFTTLIWGIIMILLLPWPYLRIRQGNVYGHVTGSLVAGRAVVEKDLSMIIFPEGTRSGTGRLLPFKKGFVHMALQTKLPIVTIVLEGTHLAWRNNSLRVRPTPLTIKYLPPIQTGNWTADRIEEYVKMVHDVYVENLPESQRPLQIEEIGSNRTHNHN